MCVNTYIHTHTLIFFIFFILVLITSDRFAQNTYNAFRVLNIHLQPKYWLLYVTNKHINVVDFTHVNFQQPHKSHKEHKEKFKVQLKSTKRGLCHSTVRSLSGEVSMILTSFPGTELPKGDHQYKFRLKIPQG